MLAVGTSANLAMNDACACPGLPRLATFLPGFLESSPSSQSLNCGSTSASNKIEFIYLNRNLMVPKITPAYSYPRHEADNGSSFVRSDDDFVST